MKRKKDVIDSVSLLFKDNTIEIYTQNKELFFEIGNEITTDTAEAVAIIMRNTNIRKSDLWNIEVKNTNIEPLKSLYWLSGGDKEWINPEHYTEPWCICHVDYEDEYYNLIVKIVRRSRTLGDIRREFNKYLSLPSLYDFAISKKLIK